jgi:ubiquitin-like modifier-activating enzyme 5
LLNFGNVSRYLGYNALDDFFPLMSLKPNESCSDRYCVKRQSEFQEREAKRIAEMANQVEEVKYEEENLHPDNEFRKILIKLFNKF